MILALIDAWEIEGDRCPSEWQEESGPLLTVVLVSNYLQGVLHFLYSLRISIIHKFNLLKELREVCKGVLYVR